MTGASGRMFEADDGRGKGRFPKRLRSGGSLCAVTVPVFLEDMNLLSVGTQLPLTLLATRLDVFDTIYVLTLPCPSEPLHASKLCQAGRN